jgi:hypothetical protein
MAEYLGYAICFLFLEDGIEWSVYVNESGILVTQEPDVMHFEYPDYDAFTEAFPDMAMEVKVIVLRKIDETLLSLRELQ